MSDAARRFVDLATRVRRLPPRAGATRLVCVDGPAGSGKTTFALRLVAHLEASGSVAVVHLDDVYEGWSGMAEAAARLRTQVVDALVAGRPAAYRRWDWHAGSWAGEVQVPAADVLVVDGVASGDRLLGDVTSLLVWVEAPEPLRTSRGVERDGPEVRPRWRAWADEETGHFTAERTRERADLRVDGAPWRPHDPETEFVELSP